MNYLLISICLLFILEGLGPLLFPNKWKRYMQEMSEQSEAVLRRIGGVLVVIGAMCLYFVMQGSHH